VLLVDGYVNLKILCNMLGSSLMLKGVKYALSLALAINGVKAMHKVRQRLNRSVQWRVSSSAAPSARSGCGFLFATRVLRQSRAYNDSK